jgi:tetratricopeptide (TPR) repeat protein
MILPDIVEAATKLIQSARFDEAENLLKDSPGIEKDAAAQQLMGIIAFQTNRAAEAVIYFETAAHELTEDGYLQNNLGQAYKLLGNLNRAKKAFKKAAQLQAEFADPLNYLGLLLRQEGSEELAETAFASAISRRPGYAEAHFNMGALMQDQNRFEDARAQYQLALRAKPSYVQAINNLGTVLDDLGDHAAAESTYRQGLEISPETPELYVSLGSCLRQQARYQEACAEFMKAVKIAPKFSEVKWNLGFLQLAMADNLDGWDNYRYRHSVDRDKYPLPFERLDDDLTGHQIELAAEQGLGDEIFFLRFTEELIERGASVNYRPDPKIATLIERLDGIRIGGLNPRAISIADLPYLLGSAAAVPSIEIQPDADRKADMQARLSAVGPAPYIGITYRAGGAGKDTLIKNAPLGGIGTALNGVKATFIDVQRLPQPDEQTQLAEMLGREVHDFSDINADLEDALAIMTLLDDYVGVSNTNMHLRAAAGRSARVLVTHPGEYRWQVEGDHSPWFPDFQLYRQAVDGNWQGAFAELSSDIKIKYE